MNEQTTTKKPTSENMSVSCPYEQFRWYKEHPDVSPSRVFQDATRRLMYPEKIQIPTHINLIYLLNFIVGICIMLIASTAQFQLIFGLSWWFAWAVICLGGTLSLASIVTFIKDRKERKKQITAKILKE